jgi:hypothetical protein
MARTLVERLAALGLIAHPERLPGGKPTLADLCAAGVLEGGLSVGLDVRPDELVGPLCQRIGGEALRLRVLDSRDAPPVLVVQLAGVASTWAVPDVVALVTELNRCYRRFPEVRALAVLGVVDEDRQLWCIPKAALPFLLRQGLLPGDLLPGLEASPAQDA